MKNGTATTPNKMNAQLEIGKIVITRAKKLIANMLPEFMQPYLKTPVGDIVTSNFINDVTAASRQNDANLQMVADAAMIYAHSNYIGKFDISKDLTRFGKKIASLKKAMTQQEAEQQEKQRAKQEELAALKSNIRVLKREIKKGLSYLSQKEAAAFKHEMKEDLKRSKKRSKKR